MTNATLNAFRQIHEDMQTEPTDWQWVGLHLSQRMFGITRTRAEAFAQAHGGEARQMAAPCAERHDVVMGRCVRCGTKVATPQIMPAVGGR